jgi:hypothetical protein
LRIENGRPGDQYGGAGGDDLGSVMNADAAIHFDFYMLQTPFREQFPQPGNAPAAG